MSFWTGIKHAINSTLGTNKFKPLDKIVEDVVIETDRKNKIFVVGNYTIYSDNSSVESNTSKETIFIPSINGQIGVNAGNTTKPSGNYAMQLAIYEDDILVFSKNADTISTTINVTSGKTYKFVRLNYFSDYGAFKLSLSLSADVKQLGYFEITT